MAYRGGRTLFVQNAVPFVVPAGAIIVEPDDITGLYLWLKADAGAYKDAGTTLAANGETVQQWNDQTVNARNFSQAGAGSRPLYQTGQINSLPTLLFADATDFLNGPDFSALTAAEVFIVFKKTTSPPAGFSTSGFCDFGTSTDEQLVPYFVDQHIYDEFGSTARRDTGVTSLGTSFHLYNAITASGEWTLNIDGTQQFTTGTNTVGFVTTTVIGANQSPQTVFFDGMFAEIILYDHKLTAGDRTSIKTYITSRYGIILA